MIVILWYNKLNETRRCLFSLLEKDIPPHNILLWDNGSTKENAELLRNEFPHCLHGRDETNRGYAGGFNRALTEAWKYSDRALFLTNDTRLLQWDPKHTLSLIQEYQSCLIAPLIVKENKPQDIDSFGGWFDNNTANLFHHKTHSLPTLLINHEYIPGTALWITQSAFEKLGGMNETFFTYWEDVDFSFRAHTKNLPLLRDPATIIAHRIGKTCHKNPLYTTYYYQRNRWLFVNQHFTGDNLLSLQQQILSDWRTLFLKALSTSNKEKIHYFRQLFELASSHPPSEVLPTTR